MWQPVDYIVVLLCIVIAIMQLSSAVGPVITGVAPTNLQTELISKGADASQAIIMVYIVAQVQRRKDE